MTSPDAPDDSANLIVADALEAAARLQESGTARPSGNELDDVWSRIRSINPHYGKPIGFAFTFWDQWIEAANHDWQYYEPVKEADWPRFAREIASAVRVGRMPDQLLLDQFSLKPSRTFRQWFWSLFGSTLK